MRASGGTDGIEATAADELVPFSMGCLEPEDVWFPADEDEQTTCTVPPPSSRCRSERECEVVLELQRAAQAGLLTSSLTHDVNNHVQSILAFAFMALKEDDPDAWRAALEKIRKRCGDLEETNRAFLEFVRHPDSVAHGEFCLAEVVTETARIAAPLARSHRVEITPLLVEDARVRGELRLAIQALVNLVSNAIRACSGRRGRVEIEASRSGNGRCQLVVIDNGSGIPKQIRGALFRPFVSGHPKSGGHGLGLFIVQQIIRSFGGSIAVRTSSKGTTFVLDLPAADELPVS
ncbi:MAG: sensor histidine kinase [Planctomycetota bacterium]|jgi:signal transduction histidine kinase